MRIWAIKKILLSAVIVCVVVAVLAAYKPSREARQATQAVQGVPVEQLTTPYIRTLVTRFGGTYRCINDWCEAEINVSNRFLSRIHLAPPMRFRILVHTLSDKLANYSLLLENESKNRSSVLVAQFSDPNASGLQPGEAYRIEAGVKGHDKFVTVRALLAGPKATHKFDNELRVACLSMIGGCSQSQIAPALWKAASWPVLSQ